MALQTPKTRSTGLQRPSYGSSVNGSSPANGNSKLSASAAVNRKASLQALTGAVTPGGMPKTPAGNGMAGEDLAVGDAVNVPGEMFGVVKFVGSVKGKSGKFVGVELDASFAARGKNDGDVDGIHYFHTSVPGSGIFLPSYRAEKRFSSLAAQSSPETEPSPTPSQPQHKFAQTVGPGARPPSPSFKPKRPSLPRPESPFRKQPPNLQPTPGRTLSQSTRGVAPGLGSSIGPGGRPGTTPSKNNFKASTSGMRPPTTGGASQTPRPYSRSGSRIGSRNDEETIGAAVTSNSRTTSQGSVPSFSQPLRSPSRLGSAGGSQDPEIARLKSELKERDKRLEEQAASLADMEQSVKELSNIIPSDGVGSPDGKTRSIGSFGGDDDASAAQLRQILREKNEKISLLTAEFDAHRADFRSTLDSLEMASTETERVYEEQKRDLMQQLAELQEVKESKEDFEGITSQLKQLEELVAELEEGLEESRRGEAEARGEVEFLRGEVERGRSELKREREKAAATANGNVGTASPKELEQKDDEIRGLKAIIHGLSSNPGNPNAGSGATPNGILADAGEVKRLQVALDEAQNEKESLEQEIEQLRRDAAATNGITHNRNESERTATAPESRSPGRSRSNTVKATATATHTTTPPLPTADTTTPSAETNGGVYCEMCDSSSHDTLDCTQLQGDQATHYSRGKENESLQANSKTEQEEDKWCALCEKDGHLAFDCPEEQY